MPHTAVRRAPSSVHGFADCAELPSTRLCAWPSARHGLQGPDHSTPLRQLCPPGPRPGPHTLASRCPRQGQQGLAPLLPLWGLGCGIDSFWGAVVGERGSQSWAEWTPATGGWRVTSHTLCPSRRGHTPSAERQSLRLPVSSQNQVAPKDCGEGHLAGGCLRDASGSVPACPGPGEGQLPPGRRWGPLTREGRDHHGQHFRSGFLPASSHPTSTESNKSEKVHAQPYSHPQSAGMLAGHCTPSPVSTTGRTGGSAHGFSSQTKPQSSLKLAPGGEP